MRGHRVSVSRECAMGRFRLWDKSSTLDDSLQDL